MFTWRLRPQPFCPFLFSGFLFFFFFLVWSLIRAAVFTEHGRNESLKHISIPLQIWISSRVLARFWRFFFFFGNTTKQFSVARSYYAFCLRDQFVVRSLDCLAFFGYLSVLIRNRNLGSITDRVGRYIQQLHRAMSWTFRMETVSNVALLPMVSAVISVVRRFLSGFFPSSVVV